MRIGRPGAADLSAVVALERGTRHAPHWPEASYVRLLAAEGDPARWMAAAWAGAELRGFAVMHLCGDEAEVESVAVDEGFRRRGIGRRLMQAVMDWSREQGARSIGLEVREGSVGARALYGDCGFVETGRRARYYTDPDEDAVLMRCELEPQGEMTAEV